MKEKQRIVQPPYCSRYQSSTIWWYSANVTISCDDPFPAIPVPTATDLCDGNVTGSITASSSVSQGGNCMPGDAVETTEYSWTVTDAAGNAANANWTVTIISDFEFDLGSDLSICGGNSVTLTAGNIGTSICGLLERQEAVFSASTAGTYGLTITSANGCCFSDEVMVSGGKIQMLARLVE